MQSLKHFFEPLKDKFESRKDDSRTVSRQKYFYDSFDVIGNEDWDLFDKFHRFRSPDREGLSHPKPDLCFPWLIVEYKEQDEKKEEQCHYQAANAGSAALMLLQTAAVFAEFNEECQHVPPVVTATTIGRSVRVWVVYYHRVNGHDAYRSGDGDVPTALSLARILDEAVDKGFYMGRQHAPTFDQQLLIDATRYVCISENTKVLKQVENILESKLEDIRCSIAAPATAQPNSILGSKIDDLRATLAKQMENDIIRKTDTFGSPPEEPSSSSHGKDGLLDKPLLKEEDVYQYSQGRPSLQSAASDLRSERGGVDLKTHGVAKGKEKASPKQKQSGRRPGRNIPKNGGIAITAAVTSTATAVAATSCAAACSRWCVQGPVACMVVILAFVPAYGLVWRHAMALRRSKDSFAAATAAAIAAAARATAAATAAEATA
ncbi:hypothetical protein SCUP515_10873 [Seiridium cupressi]